MKWRSLSPTGLQFAETRSEGNLRDVARIVVIERFADPTQEDLRSQPIPRWEPKKVKYLENHSLQGTLSEQDMNEVHGRRFDPSDRTLRSFGTPKDFHLSLDGPPQAQDLAG
jgi:hypothetical protein